MPTPTFSPRPIAIESLEEFHLTKSDGRASLSRLHAKIGSESADGWRLRAEGSDGATAICAISQIPWLRGDVGLLQFHARTRGLRRRPSDVRLAVVLRRWPDYTPAVDNAYHLTPEWTEISAPFSVGYDSPGGLELTLRRDGRGRSIEVAGVRLSHFSGDTACPSLPTTRVTYAGRAPGASWREAAHSRIRRYRMGEFEVHVSDEHGRPAVNADIRVDLLRSAFQFGSALQARRLVQDTPENLNYRRIAAQFFNAASLENDLKWPVWENEWRGMPSRAESLCALRWLKANGFHCRGHVLVWPSWRNLPKSVSHLRGTARQTEIPTLVRRHIAALTGATRGLVDEWDALNEPYDNHDLMDVFGAEFMADVFHAAADAGVPLFLNDYDNHDRSVCPRHVRHFEQTVRFLQRRGAPLGGLGLQAHIGSLPNAPERVLELLDEYHRFGLPIRFTEFDFNTDDEELQAEYTRDLLLLAYSHPGVVGFQTWGFWAQAHWRPRAAMFRSDWSEKPNALAYRALVLDAWKTRVRGSTGASGRFSGAGHAGQYAVVVVRQGSETRQEFMLPAGRTVRVDLKIGSGPVSPRSGGATTEPPKPPDVWLQEGAKDLRADTYRRAPISL